MPRPGDAQGPEHRQHDRNATAARALGLAHAFTGEARYAARLRELLLVYAGMYSGLPANPFAARGSVEAGRLYWQTLDEAVWLVRVAEGLDAAHNAIPPADHAIIAERLARPMVDLLLNQGRAQGRTTPANMLNNRALWCLCAIAFTGGALEDEAFYRRAILGSAADGIKDGFLANVEALLSPDGLYNEGAYYASYAFTPLFYLAELVARREPAHDIYGVHLGVLRKALLWLANLAYPTGAVVPLDDADKAARLIGGGELVAADALLARFPADPALRALAALSPTRQMAPSGLGAATALAAGAPTPGALADMPLPSAEYRDGSGGVGVLRRGGTYALLKYGRLGSGHGHYDKLHYVLFADGREVVPDYGWVRFVSDASKSGGRYLPLNETYAKQTVAHNTVVVDEQRQSPDQRAGQGPSDAQRRLFDASNPAAQLVSATADAVYPTVRTERTLVLIDEPAAGHPFLIDLYRCASDRTHRYDWVLHHLGEPGTVEGGGLQPASGALGAANGYQHVALLGRASPPAGLIRYAWRTGDAAARLLLIGPSGTTVLLSQLGAADPNGDLRLEPMLVVRADGQAEALFAAVVDPHGTAAPAVTGFTLVASSATGTTIELAGRGWRRQLSVGHGLERQWAWGA